jgi:hypothetical protein
MRSDQMKTGITRIPHCSLFKAVPQNSYLKRYRRMVTSANTGAIFADE